MATQSGKKPITAARQAVRRVLRAMAYDRQAYINKISQHCRGAAREFYKARLAEKNGFPEHVAGWDAEVEGLLLSAQTAAGWQISGFTDREKAAEEALKEVSEKDRNLRTQAINHIKTYYGLTRVKTPLNEQDTAALTGKLRSAVMAGLKETKSAPQRRSKK
jgi:hypothetical protein